MTAQPAESVDPKRPLSRERVLRAAVDLADREGIRALTMRRLAEDLGVEAMSLYYHVANKEALLDGVVDLIVAEINSEVKTIDTPRPEDDWKQAMRLRILTAREVMFRHRWAPKVIEERTTISPQMVFYFDGLIEIFAKGGLTYDLAHHAMHALGSRALGFTQELFEPDEQAEKADGSDAMMEAISDQVPYLVAMLDEVMHEGPDTTLGWCDDQTEFLFGLDLILDGLERLSQNEATG